MNAYDFATNRLINCILYNFIVRDNLKNYAHYY